MQQFRCNATTSKRTARGSREKKEAETDMIVVLWLWIILPLVLHSSLSLGWLFVGAFAAQGVSLWLFGFGLRVIIRGFAGMVVVK